MTVTRQFASIVRRISIHDIFLLFLLYVTLTQLSGFADDPGLGWHLTNGAAIISSGRIPYYDGFLAGDAPRPWVSDQWLSDVIMQAVFVSGGWPSLYAVWFGLFFVTFAGFLFNAAFRYSSSYLGSVLGLIVAVKLAQIHLILRPVVLSFLLFSLLYIYLSGRLRAHETPRILPVFSVFILWASLHPSFFLGFLLIALFFIAAVFSGVAERGRYIYKALPVLPAALLAGFINPYGPDLHRSIVYLGQSSYFMSLNTEWHGLKILSFEGRLFVFSLASFVCLNVAARHSLQKLLNFENLCFLMFAALSLKSVRFLPYMGICFMLPVSKLFADAAAVSPAAGRGPVRRLISLIDGREKHTGRGKLTLGLSLAAVIVSAFCFQLLPGWTGGFGPSEERFPYAAMERLNGYAAQSGGVSVAATPDWGGFIVFKSVKSGGRNLVRPVIDDRNALLGEEFYRRFFEIMRPGPGLIPALDSLKSDYLLLSPAGELAKYIESNNLLPVVYSDSVSVLFRTH